MVARQGRQDAVVCRRNKIGLTGAEERKYAGQVQKKGNRLDGCRRKETGWTGAEERK